MVVILSIAQAALWSHANSVAQAAADFGAERASAFGATTDEGAAAAEAFLAQAGGVANGAATVATEGADRVTVVVTGNYPGVFGSFDVRASSTSVREQLPG